MSQPYAEVPRDDAGNDDARCSKLPVMKRRTLLQAGAGVVIAAHSEVSGAAASGAKNKTGTSGRREELYELLGKLPPRDRKVSAQLVSTEDRGNYTLEKLVLDLNGEEPAPA